MRAEFLRDHDRQHATREELQQAFDSWVQQYNWPHQSLGMRPLIERFQLAVRDPKAELQVVDPVPIPEADNTNRGGDPAAASRMHGVQRWVDGAA